MQISIGNGGWTRVDWVELPGPLYVRFSPTDSGRWSATEVYIDGRGAPVTGAMLRTLPLADIEDVVNGEETVEHLRSRAALRRVLLSEAASYYATGFGPKARGWIAEMHLSQRPDQPATRRQPSPGDEVHAEAPPLQAPDEGLTDEFLRSVARAYEHARLRRERPAVALAEQVGAGTSVRTVHRWIYLARKRGLLAPAAPRKRRDKEAVS